MSKTSKPPRPKPPAPRADARPAGLPAPVAPAFSRPVDVRSLPAAGLDLRISAEPAEREAVARDLGAVSVAELSGAFSARPGARGQVLVHGAARARVTRECVVTLEPFEETVEEKVDLVFAPAPDHAPAHGRLTTGRSEHEDVDLAALSSVDPPDPIVDGRIDFGALLVEFVMLGLDPYPRKPGAVFKGGDGEGEASPFGALGGLAPPRAPEE